MQTVEIRVKGLLDPEWSEWLENLTVVGDTPSQTLLTGQIVDQATLYGILNKLRDLGLKLISVKVDDVDSSQ